LYESTFNKQLLANKCPYIDIIFNVWYKKSENCVKGLRKLQAIDCISNKITVDTMASTTIFPWNSWAYKMDAFFETAELIKWTLSLKQLSL